ncbi:MAG TPA: (2Fe-2S)-binding protein [Candidatus Wallbacteria bacterium]|nr:(2Fe-2S)-binding protein [Candidatus Wallbacteria bacterium]
MPNRNFTAENLKLKDSIDICFKLNSREVNIKVPCTYTLLDILRYELKHTGTKEGCGMGECGACTVIMDGGIVNACLVLSTAVSGRDIWTIEGVSAKEDAKPIIDAFVAKTATQCGFCTPGMVMASYYLLSKYKDPTDEQIQEGLSGNLCRCTGYAKIIEAVKAAARELNGAKKEARDA